MEWAHGSGLIPFDVPRWLSLGLILVIFAVAYLQARRRGPVTDSGDEAAAELLRGPRNPR